MNTAFLLRFQEDCLREESPCNRATDPTMTEVQPEQPDVDCLSGDHRTLPAVPRSAADPTKTAVDSAEAPDEAANCGITTLPLCTPLPSYAVNPTHTLIRAEAPDESIECSMMALPFEASDVCPTATCTRTLAETNDTDFGHSDSRVIPRCS